MLETPYFMEVNNTIEEGLSTLIEFDEKNFKKIISLIVIWMEQKMIGELKDHS